MAQATGRIVPGEESAIHDEPHIEGRRITVLQVVERVEGADRDPKAVADEYDLPVADVYRALTYYHDHPDEMAGVRERRREREASARERGAKTLDELRSDRE
ncbi:DUF433 domain-containing protein [Halosimplex marinum]|uniref:DUF433 domain-containing protein n=1 Tax=Halosimplex marinum TaxID=3396620 RepID=UPI003F566E13